jgi:hypothetical protein
MQRIHRLGLAAILLGGWACSAGLTACSSSSGGELFGGDGQDASAADATVDSPAADSTVDLDSADEASDDPDTAPVPKKDSGPHPADAGADHDASLTDAAADAPADSGVDASGDTGSDAAADGAPSDGGLADGDCGPPFTIFTNDAGPFCPFTAAGPANCTVGQHCCEYTLEAGVASTCNEANGACLPLPGTIDWGCDEKNDCPGSEVCCYVGQLKQDNPSCPALRGTSISGTVCRPGACNSGERVACGSQADCASGTCTGINARGKDLGLCIP